MCVKWHCIVGMTHACAEVGAVADMQERGGGDPNRGARTTTEPCGSDGRGGLLVMALHAVVMRMVTERQSLF